MNTNIIPSCIIAVAIIVAAFIPKPQGTTAIAAGIDELVKAAEVKDSKGETQFSRLVKGISKSASAGFSAGMQGSNSEIDKNKLAARDNILIKEVKLIKGRQKTQERLIGIARNDGAKTIIGLSFVIAFKDKDGKLMDVAASFARVEGYLKPGEESVFEVSRELGEYNEKEEVLALRRASTADVRISDLRIVEQ